MDEMQYTNTYVATVSTVDILLSNARQGRLRRWESKAETAQAFVLEWDSLVNRSAGYRKLQMEREAFIARRVHQVAGKSRDLLAIVEAERAAGVLTRLRA
jgi:hypothetical protein